MTFHYIGSHKKPQAKATTGIDELTAILLCWCRRQPALQRGITVSYEAIRLWCNKFGSKHAQRLIRKYQGYGDTLFIDEMFVKIQEKKHYLWRAVGQDDDVVDVFLPKRRDGKAAKRFFNLLLRIHKVELRKIFTDKLRICSVAHREFIPETFHDTTKCVSN
ncbi:MAG: putative transposase, partial [Dinoroseobacter sp.]